MNPRKGDGAESFPTDSTPSKSSPPDHYGQQLSSPVKGDIEDYYKMEWYAEADEARETAELSARLQARLKLARIVVPEFVFPKSSYDGYIRPLEISGEKNVLKAFFVFNYPLNHLADYIADILQDEQEQEQEQAHNSEVVFKSRGGKRQNNDEFNQIELHNFSIYRPESKNTQSGELAPLHFLCAKSANNDYYFDGILVDGNSRRYVEKVPFEVLSIGNYLDTSLHTVGDQIWIRSSQYNRREVWYQLKEPAPEYREYHGQFVWLAEFTKHFVDFLDTIDKVSLHHFRQQFHDWALELHGKDTDFNRWISAYGHTDFRSVVAANFEFLWKEANGVDNGLHKHPIWTEVDPKRLTAVKEHRSKMENTVVTPYVYECFKRFPFGEYFNVITPNPKVLASRRKREMDLDLTVEKCPSYAGNPDNGPSLSSFTSTRARYSGGFEILKEFFDERMNPKDDERWKQAQIEAKARVARDKFVGPVILTPTRIKRDSYGRLIAHKPKVIREGDVVAVKKDFQSVWKGESDLWFAYVQEVRHTKKGRQFLKVIWLYEPSDTSCSTMYYPFRSELFFSDNCNCGDGVLDADDVLCIVSVAFFSKPGESCAEYFVRQKYNTSDASFVSLKQPDFKCMHLSAPELSHMEEAKKKYRIGDTVLTLKDSILEPVQLVGFEENKVLVRRLSRRSRDYREEQNSRPNELVWTKDIYPVRPEDIDRKCLIRFYTEEEKLNRKISAPYNRDGTADAYFITSREVPDGSHKLIPLAKPFPSMNQGFNPDEAPCRPMMNGMDLFCGGGNFGRGLEEGGAVRNKWAVDIGKEQIHTYRANLKTPDDTKLYFGSINDILRNGLKGNFSSHVPEPGEVDFISAGSPCQGFSNANNRREEEKGLRNCSLVASVAAFVDFYRPKYALLENVAGMASKKHDRNVFSQLLCSLVGMGYQVQQFNLDAWSFGSPQSRSRLFVSIAAPGFKLPPHPALSHSHPPGKGDRGIGTGANGEKYGRRRFEITPFEYVTATEATNDLPFIGQSRSHTCIRYPDHRQSCTKNNLKRILVNCVPVNPRQQSFIRALNSGRMPKLVVDNYSWGGGGHKRSLISRSWQRIDPNALMPTITTSAQPACAFTGALVHWDQHRLLTVMEARRAQGFPDDEVLIGAASAQWKIVGNSVARTVALALGMSMREAWMSNDEDAPSYGAQKVVVEAGVCQHDTVHAGHSERSSSVESGSTLGQSPDRLGAGLITDGQGCVAYSKTSDARKQTMSTLKRKHRGLGVVGYETSLKKRKLLAPSVLYGTPEAGSYTTPAQRSGAAQHKRKQSSKVDDTTKTQSSLLDEMHIESVSRTTSVRRRREFYHEQGIGAARKLRLSGVTHASSRWANATALDNAYHVGNSDDSDSHSPIARRSVSVSSTGGSPSARALSLSSTSEAPGAPMSMSTPPGESDLEIT